jgi:hypothetical protein
VDAFELIAVQFLLRRELDGLENRFVADHARDAKELFPGDALLED